MSFDRKTFLKRAAAATAGLVAANTLRAQSSPPTAVSAVPVFKAEDPESFWQEVRSLFLLSRELTYFNTGGLGPTWGPALTAMTETMRKLQEKSEHGHGRFAEVRAAVAKFLGAEPAEIALVRNATEGNAIIASGVKLAPGDEVIFETHAHPGGSFPWLNQEKLRGITVKLFEPDPQSAAANVARIRQLMTKRTRVVQVSHVTAPTGILLPVAEIGQLCRERGVWFHVDGAQSAGMFPFSVRALGCDSFATSGHKWLGAPHETGVLYVRQDRIKDVAPTLVGAYSGDVDMLPGELRLHKHAERFEYGTRNVATAVGLGEAIRLQEQIGRERIAQRGRALAARVHAGLSGIRGVEMLTSSAPEVASSMVTFRTATVPFDTLFSRLLRDHALRCRPVSEQKLNAVRVSLHVCNLPAECDALVAAVDKIVRSA